MQKYYKAITWAAHFTRVPCRRQDALSLRLVSTSSLPAATVGVAKTHGKGTPEDNNSDGANVKEAPRRFGWRDMLQLIGFTLSFGVLATSIYTCCYYAYKYVFYVPTAVTDTWNAIKDDEWIQKELNGPIRMRGRWNGYVGEEEAKIYFDIEGPDKKRYGKLYADLILNPTPSLDDTSPAAKEPNSETASKATITADAQKKWTIITMRFARFDAEAEAANMKPTEDPSGDADTFFTSNNGPGTKTTVRSMTGMARGCPHDMGNLGKGFPLTDDVVASRGGKSVGILNQRGSAVALSDSANADTTDSGLVMTKDNTSGANNSASAEAVSVCPHMAPGHIS